MSSDESCTDKECPLCMEPFDFDDLNFYPCTCQYQICRFCWHRLRTDENGLCPACRQPYPENPVNYQPVSGSELQKIKSKSKMASKSGKVKTADGRKHLANYRVLQKNLVYVVGLSQKLADVEMLKRPEFFGKFGKILKVVVGTAAIPPNAIQPTSCTAYVTYAKDDDALRAIEAVNNAILDGRLLKASLGTTKYCSTFLRGQTCHKAIGGKMDCMYLHTIAEPEASFTKEDMHAGKHTEFERKLHEDLAARTGAATTKRRVVSGSEKADLKREEEEEEDDLDNNDEMAIEAEADTNISEPETNSSEQENSVALDAECAALTSGADEPQLVHHHHHHHPYQQQQNINVLQSLSQNTDDMRPVYSSHLRHSTSTPSSPLPTFASLQNHHNIQQPSITNKFTTCEDFERMLMMEDNNQTDTNSNNTHYNGNTHPPNINFDDDLGFDPFSESIKGLADLVIEEQECRKQQQIQQQQQTQNNLNFLFNRFQPQTFSTQQQTQPPIQRPSIQTETPRLYNSYLHQTTYMRYNQLRDYAKSALNATGGWPVGPPPGLAAMGSPAGNGFFSQK